MVSFSFNHSAKSIMHYLSRMVMGSAVVMDSAVVMS